MPSLNHYLLDANVFIEAKRRYYSFDLCPGFWDCILWHWKRKRLYSIDRIRSELTRGKDDLCTWIETNTPASMFKACDGSDVQKSFTDIVAWVQGAGFFPEAQTDFSAGADAWLIAYARVNRVTLVTQEQLRAGAKNRVPIPNVCEEFGVAYTDAFAMLKKLNATFSWEADE